MKAFGLVVDLETDKVWFSSTELYVEWQTVGNHHRTRTRITRFLKSTSRLRTSLLQIRAIWATKVATIIGITK